MKKDKPRLVYWTLLALALSAILAGGFTPYAAQAQQAPPPRGMRRPTKQGVQQREGQKRYSIEQAVSDRAQLHTIAFNGLAFLTGDFGASTFMPPGKVCDFFGFQYMRDIDAAGKGHNPMFLDRVAANVHHVLNDQQRKVFEDLAAEQAPQLADLAMKRLPLIKAFHRQLDGAIPAGSAGLNKDAVVRSVGDLFAFDGELSYRRAEVFGAVAASLSAEQKAYLAKMKFGDFTTWPTVDGDDRFRPPRGNSKLYGVAYMTYASEFFSWYAGSIEADTYFCPERHGTYFGGFYMKDMPAMGQRDYDISTSVTGDSGEAFLNTLTVDQRRAVTQTIELQRKALAETVEVRRAISTQLRGFLDGRRPDKSKVVALCRRYGELDGEMSWYYATAFAQVARTLTPEQRATLKRLRNLEGYASAPAYLYSEPLAEEPTSIATDMFFADAKADDKP